MMNYVNWVMRMNGKHIFFTNIINDCIYNKDRGLSKFEYGELVKFYMKNLDLSVDLY